MLCYSFRKSLLKIHQRDFMLSCCSEIWIHFLQWRTARLLLEVIRGGSRIFHRGNLYGCRGRGTNYIFVKIPKIFFCEKWTKFRESITAVKTASPVLGSHPFALWQYNNINSAALLGQIRPRTSEKNRTKPSEVSCESFFLARVAVMK